MEVSTLVQGKNKEDSGADKKAIEFIDGCLYSQAQKLFRRETAPTEAARILFGRLEDTHQHEEGSAA